MSWLSPYRWLLIAAAIAALLLGINRWNAHQQDIGYEKARAEYTAAALVATQVARAKEQQLQTKVNEAVNAAKTRETKLAADAGRARAVADSLRDDLAAARSQVSSASIASLRQRITAFDTVFGQCTAEVERLAGDAQGIASDARLILDAWPK